MSEICVYIDIPISQSVRQIQSSSSLPSVKALSFPGVSPYLGLVQPHSISTNSDLTCNTPWKPLNSSWVNMLACFLQINTYLMLLIKSNEANSITIIQIKSSCIWRYIICNPWIDTIMQKMRMYLVICYTNNKFL